MPVREVHSIMTMFENITLTPFENLNTTTAKDDHGLMQTMKQVMQYLLMGLMVVIMFSLGCTIEVPKLKKTFLRPVGLAIGLLCQFILYPPLTFGLAHALRLSKWNALGMITLGTCPGGSMSNVYTYWANGDVTLSIGMTAVSTTVGIGMMPLNLWIYSRSWADESIVIPYVNIVIALVSIVIPVAAGMLTLIKFPKASKWIVKIGGVLGFVIILFTMGGSIYMAPDLIQRYLVWSLWFSAAILPAIGLALGYILSLIARRPHVERRAIAIETSTQNVALCMALISISFNEDAYLKVMMFPQIFGLFSVIEQFIFAFVHRMIDRRRKKKKQPEGRVTQGNVNSEDPSTEKELIAKVED